jgi:hypothetical protein
MAEMYDLYAAQYFYHQDEPIFQELVDKALEYCDEGQRMVNTFGEVYQRDILFSRPWSLRISIYMTMGDMDKLVSFRFFLLDFFFLIFVVVVRKRLMKRTLTESRLTKSQSRQFEWPNSTKKWLWLVWTASKANRV